MNLKQVIDDHLVMSRKDRAEFAKHVGLSGPRFSRWLNGTGDMSADHMGNLVRWLLKTEDVDGEETEDDIPPSD